MLLSLWNEIDRNPFGDPAIAAGYERWYDTAGRRADRREKTLLRWLLVLFGGAQTILEVGCGTGHFTRWFEELGLEPRGLILGVLNVDSRLGRLYVHKGGPIWGAARFYTPAELKQMIWDVAGGKVQVVWRTTLWPFWPSALPLPWGGFIGMAVGTK